MRMTMKVPGELARQIAKGASLGFACDATGNTGSWPEVGGIYPPVDYLRWDVLEVGNGDDYGYYWPVGMEEREPIVCTTEHDTASLIPIASSLSGCLRCARCWLEHLQARSCPRPRHSRSALPHLLLTAARERFRSGDSGDLASAEEWLRLALDLLPEYAEASFALAQLYRRRHEMTRAAETLP